MSRRTIIIIIAAVAAIAVASVAWYAIKKQQGRQTENEHPTDSVIVFDDERQAVDTLLLGRWQNKDNPQWYKVYYDDYADNGCCWGKEWNEEDDVLEEDLKYHGNGWFRWERRGGELLEYSTMDACDVPIAKIYKVLKNDGAEMCVFEKMGKKKYEFRKTAKW